MSTTKIQATKNYKLFKRHDDENRPLNVATRRKLMQSMKLYGFLKCYPIICYRTKAGQLVVKDGQHRLAIAEELGLTVYWIEDASDFDVAIVNSAMKGWTNKDYALKWAANGVESYAKMLEFAERFDIAVQHAVALLSGTTVFTNVRDAFIGGTFKIKDQKWAEAVASLYSQIGQICPRIKDQFFMLACMAVCRIEDFDHGRLIVQAEKCREKLLKYGTRDGYLGMIEEVYNYGRRRVPVTIPAQNAMRERNATEKKKKAAVAEPQKKAA